MADELWRMGAVDLAAAIRARQISSRETVESALTRMEAVNPVINAVVVPMVQQAREAAAAADAALARGEPVGPLHGVPITVKMNVDVAGMPRTNGLHAFKDRVSTDDSPVVTNLRKAGAVFLGLTNCPAFAARPFTSNELHGETYNPWGRSFTPGGSSGGAAAAVAAGIGALGHGNDLGGSVRQPTACCGVVGLRCTPSRIPNYNPSVAKDRPYLHQSTTSQGPIARSVADARLGYEVMSARDPRDPWWVPALPESESLKLPVRVALFTGPAGTDAAVVNALRQAARWLEEAGCTVEEVEPPRYEEAWDLHRALLHAERENGTLRDIERHGDEAVRRAMRGRVAFRPRMIPGRDEYIEAVALRSTILREWNLFFERYPLLVMPIAYRHAMPAEHDQRGDEAVAEVMWANAPAHVTALLALPGLCVPVGVADGAPTTVQLVAARLQDLFLFDAGALVEARAGRLTPIDPRPS
jgi:amidase